MDFETIKKLAGPSGSNYGNLSQEQKEIYTKGLQNPAQAVTPTQVGKDTVSPVRLSDQGIKDYYASQTPLANPMSPTEYGKKYPTAVVSPTQAINDVTKIKETADAANAAYLQKEAERKAAADALKTQEKPVVTPTKKTPEEMIADEPDPGNIWIYDKLGNRTQILATEQVPFGYTATNQKGSAPTEEVVGALTTYRKFADGSYGKFNTATGEYQGFATQTDFTKAQTQKTISDKIDQIALGNFVLSPTEQAQIDAVKAQYERFIKEQEIANKNLTGGTTSRMALSGLAQTTMAMQKIDKTISDGLDKVTDINMKMQATVSQMITAFKNDDLEALKSAYNNYQQDQVNQQTAFKQMHDETVQTIRDDKQQRETRINAIDNDIRAVISTAATRGVSPDQLAKMDEALAMHDINAAIAAAGSTLQNAEGWMGVYNDYARHEEAAGRTPMTPIEFKNWDDSNAAAIARAGKAVEASGGITGALDRGDVPFQATIETAAAASGSATAQKRAEEQMAKLAINGDYKSLLTRVKEEARKGMTAVDKTEVVKAEKQVKSLTRMSAAIKAYQDAGGDMGYLKGKADTVASYFGKLATDPKYKQIGTELTAAFQQYRVDMTGAAFGDTESAQYESVLPSKGKDFELNYSVIDGLKNYMNGKVDDAYSLQLGEGYENIKELANGAHPLTQQANDAETQVVDFGTKNPQFQDRLIQMQEDGISPQDILNWTKQQ